MNMSRRGFLKVALTASAIAAVPGAAKAVMREVHDDAAGVTYANIPDGWLPCDGRKISRAEYPHLFDLIGDAYGGCLPDFRGQFLRGGKPSAEKPNPSSETRPRNRLLVHIIRVTPSPVVPVGQVVQLLGSPVN